jgi:glutamine amidotransferase
MAQIRERLRKNGKKLKVPVVGWNRIYPPMGKNWKETPLKDNEEGEFMYFVHSYYTISEDENIILAQSYFGSSKYCSAVLYKNVFATQFHPEKSDINGLKILKQFMTT